MLDEDTKAARQESSFSHSCAVQALARLRCQARKVVIIILPAAALFAAFSRRRGAAPAACGKTTREQLSNFETTAVCKLHTDVAVAKVNIQFQQISFSPTLLLVAAGCSLRGARRGGSGCMLLPPSSLGTNVCTTFVAQETMRPPHCAALLRAIHDAAC